jgi:hypothetical protein
MKKIVVLRKIALVIALLAASCPFAFPQISGKVATSRLFK